MTFPLCKNIKSSMHHDRLYISRNHSMQLFMACQAKIQFFDEFIVTIAGTIVNNSYSRICLFCIPFISVFIIPAQDTLLFLRKNRLAKQ